MITRPPAGTIPDAPGSYQFKDAHGRVIYVGKAKSLRSRLSNYFQTNLPPRTAQMVATATRSPRYPNGWDIHAPFRLPYAARRVRLEPGRAVLEF